MSVRELVIIGGGPAGCSAAIYAARSRVDTTLITENFGGQLTLTGTIENYLGLKSETASEISKKFEDHVREYDIDVKMDEAEKVSKKNGHFVIETVNHGDIEAKAVLIATGTRPRNLGVEGEDEFRNKGVAYCAVCDGPLYSGEEVAVIGGAYAATEAALYLSEMTDKVYLVYHGDELSGEPITLEKIEENKKIEVVYNAETEEFYGDRMLEGLKYEDLETGKTKELKVAGAFVEIGRIPNTDLIDFVDKEKGRIIADNHGQTSEEGVFAAGDCTDIEEEQAIVAAGDGCKAALQASRFLKRQRD